MRNSSGDACPLKIATAQAREMDIDSTYYPCDYRSLKVIATRADLHYNSGSFIVVNLSGSCMHRAFCHVLFWAALTGLLILGSSLSAEDGRYAAVELSVDIGGNIKAGDDVDISAHNGLYVDAEITAGDNVKIRSSRGSMDINGNIYADDDIELISHSDLIMAAAVVAGDDVEIEVRRGDVYVTGTVLAGDDIGIRANREIGESSALSARL